MRVPTQQEYSHQRLGEKFATALSNYDTRRRVEVLVDEFLGPDGLRGRRVLDVGCGLGFFSQRAAEHGGRVTASDLGEQLVERTRAMAGCEGTVADALDLLATFPRNHFDVVISSECIEHTPEPLAAVKQMCMVLKPGGFLSLSTPNLVWQPVVRAASRLKLRAFDGHENFSTFGSLRRTLEAEGLTVVREKGLHLWPFHLPLHGLSRWADEHLQPLRPLMINLCILARKQDAAS